MQAMPEKVEFKAINDNVLKTVVRLMHHADTKDLAQPVLDALTRLEDATNAANSLRRPEIIAREWMELGRAPIVQDISDMELDAQKAVHRKLQERPYADLFGDHNVGDHRKMAPRVLQTEINRKVTVIQELPADSALRDHVPTLRELVRDWLPLVKRWEAADRALKSAEKVTADEQAALAKLLFATHGELEKRFPGNRATVESFFVPWVVRKSSTAGEPPRSGGPVPTSPGNGGAPAGGTPPAT